MSKNKKTKPAGVAKNPARNCWARCFKQGDPNRETEFCRRARRVQGPSWSGAARPSLGINRPAAGSARCRGCVAWLELRLGVSGEQALRDPGSGLKALRLARVRNRRCPVCEVGRWPGEGIGGWEARPRQGTPVRGARRSARGRWAAVLAAQAPGTVWAQAALLEQSRGECHLPLQRS